MEENQTALSPSLKPLKKSSALSVTKALERLGIEGVYADKQSIWFQVQLIWPKFKMLHSDAFIGKADHEVREENFKELTEAYYFLKEYCSQKSSKRAQQFVLAVLSDFPGATITEIAKHTEFSKVYVSEVLGDLRRQNLVKKMEFQVKHIQWARRGDEVKDPDWYQLYENRQREESKIREG